jgi:Protein of unknown function (DUF1592)/Protein of unknown function (DUF1588)/Protein of unknown function (DUF1587)/Protein of unknown function (DUF1585)/Protein of unknown function (DUF1595)/Cytochrome C oxidase, cbb3-type, subunit III
VAMWRSIWEWGVRASALTAVFLVAAAACGSLARCAEPDFAMKGKPLFARYCFDCHGAAEAEGQVNLEQMTAERAFNTAFKSWEKVAGMLAAGRMPPKDAEQPSAGQRQQMIAEVRGELERAAQEQAGDPGEVALRRLTSAEYAYTIRDLTGLELDLEREFVSDAAGGEGFTNVGTVQFFDDAGMERYLEAAKKVAAHAVIGAGELQFFSDPGKTGLELSAIDRIRKIYRQYGFRTAAGEGGVPFGLDRYPRAFFVAWRFQHRERLGLGDVSLDSLAAQEGLPPRFVQHVWSVLTASSPSFPTSEVVARWRELPSPIAGQASNDTQASKGTQIEAVRKQCEALYGFMADWQTRLARAVGDEEEAAILSESAIQVEPQHSLVARFAWMEGPPKIARVQFSVVSADPSRQVESVVIWQNPRLRFRRFTRRRDEPEPLVKVLPPAIAEGLAFGQHPRGGKIGPEDFVTVGGQTHTMELVVPEGARGLEVLVEAKLDLAHGEDCVVRCTVSEGADEKVKNVSALLADPAGAPFETWKTGVIEFARLLPQVSHREPAPSDRDPIPPPFDNTYNMPERNFFHTGVKYERDDDFLVAYLLDADARQRLDEAWIDLLASFEYYDILLRFAAEKYKFELGERTIATLDDQWIQRLSDEPRRFVSGWHGEYTRGQERLRTAESRHVADALVFAGRAWRRPLSTAEKDALVAFYGRLREGQSLDHSQAMRSLLARIFLAPAFVFRAERIREQPGIVPLSDWELASRLSYFLWSSAPDEELTRAAAAGELQDSEALAAQARRMLRDEKARRLATEFFGQWLGFYQFDRYRGVDPDKFPEFNDRLKGSLYAEAIAFFEHIVREERPLQEILFADYAFLNADVAKHYAIDVASLGEQPVRIENTLSSHRGGLLSLGAILTATSAPLRTSPVKRGDWVLRRVLGTPVPPPPANAGSIAADETPADGQTVRQRLEAHRHDATCANCHSRIDPLGFALEHYDSLGRWRETYRNQEPIDDALTLASGRQIAGIEGLRALLRENQEQFYRTLCTKLLAYALGRSELASDRQLMTQMMADAKLGEGKLAELVENIVTSRQFRHRRSGSPLAVDVKKEQNDATR